VYAYTGSVVTAAVAGTAAVLVNSAVFYVNNMAWDYYDWRRGREASQAGRPAGAAGDGKEGQRRLLQ
jgi:uncharacterized membrane protein